ncbi:MAG: hypothetical protein ACE5HW_02160, partial [Candidatus Methanofastidiosia archaeon]
LKVESSKKILYDESRIVNGAGFRLKDAEMREFLEVLGEMGFEIESNFEIPLNVSGYDVLIVPPMLSPYSAEEISFIQDFVRSGNGLFIMAESPELNLENREGERIIKAQNELAKEFYMRFSDCLPSDSKDSLGKVKFAKIHPVEIFSDHPILSGVRECILGNSATLKTHPPALTLMITGDAGCEVKGALGVLEYSQGRVVASPDASMFSLRIGDSDNERLLKNIILYLARERRGFKPSLIYFFILLILVFVSGVVVILFLKRKKSEEA